MIPELVALDLDGTVLGEDGVISDGVLTGLAETRRRGWTTVLATGRTRHGVQTLAQRYTELANHWMITSNGVMIYAPGREKPVQSLLIGVLPSLVALRAVFADLTVTLEDPSGRYPCTVPRPAEEFPGPQVVTPWELLRTRSCTRIFAASESATVPQAREIIDAAQYHADIYRLDAAPTWVELQHPRASKATALEHLRARLAVRADRTVAVGDSWNDVGMLRWAALGVAVGNAVPEALAAADARIPSCADDGVATLLDALLAGDGWPNRAPAMHGTGRRMDNDE